VILPVIVITVMDDICAPYFRVYLLAHENRENNGRAKI